MVPILVAATVIFLIGVDLTFRYVERRRTAGAEAMKIQPNMVLLMQDGGEPIEKEEDDKTGPDEA